ncbi:unnamed protein product [Durusdinium trenchii]|uniref:Uncharacterized protein n=1 Tax=Durusdinium trenchii TaxID=1381693 RepID=A0ABP0NBN6_9DINO
MGQRLLPRRRRTVVPLVAALVVPLAVLPLAKTGPLWTEGGDAHESVLAKSALADFKRELPHPWQRIGNLLLKPVSWAWPSRRGFGKNGRERLKNAGLQEAAGGSKWHSWLQEVCLVLGLDTSGHRRGGAFCPELWIDESWPPNRLTPHGQRSAPVWTFAGGERGHIVIQASLMKDFSMKGAKALLGFEVAGITLPTLPAHLPSGMLDPLCTGYLLCQASWAVHRATTPNSGLAGAPRWIREMLVHGGRFERPYSYTGQTAELAALGGLLRRLMPGVVQPPLFELLQVNHRNLEKALKHRKGLRWQLRAAPERPLEGFGKSFLVVNLMRLLGGSRGRSFVLTQDRASALCAGDAKAAALALLQARRLVPPRLARVDVDETLSSFASRAHESAWRLRRDALLRNPAEPPPAVRVAELLSWAQSEQGKRLMALAEVRRGHRVVVERLGEEVWRPWAGYAGVVGLLVLPVLTPIDAVRWASWCTMSLTIFGLMLPLLGFLGAPALPGPTFLSLGCLALYSLIAGSIWWNHLLGGARRWAILSGQLASQLVDQADAAAGIAFLTRDWAEMARRSLVALDQELCGSWRTSLHELASKLADLRQELEEPPAPSNGQKSLRDGYSSVPAEEDGMPQRLAREPGWSREGDALRGCSKVLRSITGEVTKTGAPCFRAG